ncbi:MAG TPA: succinate dehydrogenase/fumarate reductase iron-sulfur subunit [Chloroflexota bacterium]|jgi:succinate dehydrogenase/fumarate reductase iron-sulfur protein
MTGRKVQLRIRRSEPGYARVRWETFEVPLEDRATVLDALFFVLRERDRSLAFRCACRAAMCGSCAMVVNGSERLACKTPLAEVANGRPVRVEPLRNLPVVKDLVVDLDLLFDKYAAVRPWLRIDASAREPAVIPSSDRRRVEIGEGLDCINCGACYSACPMVAADPDYLGPMQLLRAFNVLADEREDPAAIDLRVDEVFGRHGVWRCHGIGECTRVCPKGLNPALAIRRLKRGALVDAFS